METLIINECTINNYNLSLTKEIMTNIINNLLSRVDLNKNKIYGDITICNCNRGFFDIDTNKKIFRINFKHDKQGNIKESSKREILNMDYLCKELEETI